MVAPLDEGVCDDLVRHDHSRLAFGLGVFSDAYRAGRAGSRRSYVKLSVLAPALAGAALLSKRRRSLRNLNLLAPRPRITGLHSNAWRNWV
jgi:hypothetical protein